MNENTLSRLQLQIMFDVLFSISMFIHVRFDLVNELMEKFC